jgi:energy-coupling factor transporter ATP-binding protein EcfA2
MKQPQVTQIDSIEIAHSKFLQVRNDVNGISKQDWTEADTRLKIIDRILFDVLGWDRNLAATENRAGVGYTDYTLRVGKSNRVLVEAKKESIDFGLSNRVSGRAYKLNGQIFSKAGRDAINQTIEYAGFKNTELGCATNGAEWIIFRANRLGDGQDTLEGSGFVFSSIDSIEGNFKFFFDLLSEESSRTLRYRGEFQRVEGVPLRDLSFFKPVRLPASKRLLPRSEFSADFDALMTSFFERLKGDQDQEMVQACFVVTSESNFADERLCRIADDLVKKLRQLDTDTGKQLVQLIEEAKLQHKNRFVLLVGNKGAGKSTFVDRFFNYVIPSQTRQDLVLTRVDLSRHTGDPNTVTAWLSQRLLEEVERFVLPIANALEGWDECIGKMFFDEYQRWSNVTMRHLYVEDKNEFKIQFGKHIEQIRATQADEYIKRMLDYVTNSAKKIPCLVFDNTDHFTIEFQEAVFQHARSIYESEFCVVIVPITDKTSWQLSKQGALQSFESEILYLPVPPAERVIERRTSFLLKKIEESNADKNKDYFLSRGIRLRLDDIAKFAYSLNKLFIESRETSKLIGGLANLDIRRVLQLTKDAIASPHLKLEDLVKSHVSGRADSMPAHRVKQAIIKRGYDIYPSGNHSFVQNLFSISTDPPTTPLLGVRILQFLSDANEISDTEGTDLRNYVPVSKIFDYMSQLIIPPQITEIWLNTLLQSGLVLNYDPTVTVLGPDSSLEISPSGMIHLAWALHDREYIQHMKDVTPLRDKNVYDELNYCFADYKNRWKQASIAFVNYLIGEDALWSAVPSHSSYDGQRAVAQSLKRVISALH